METIHIKAYPSDITQIETLKAFMKALKIKFDITKITEEKPYDVDFEQKIIKAEEGILNGKGSKMSISEFKSLCK
ncbi:MAG: hypothetical protein SFY32_13335 [Bacteroidota bacterium]|nr:hypothetical protein [Bacteroidota bacterium]